MQFKSKPEKSTRCPIHGDQRKGCTDQKAFPATVPGGHVHLLIPGLQNFGSAKRSSSERNWEQHLCRIFCLLHKFLKPVLVLPARLSGGQLHLRTPGRPNGGSAFWVKASRRWVQHSIRTSGVSQIFANPCDKFTILARHKTKRKDVANTRPIAFIWKGYNLDVILLRNS